MLFHNCLGVKQSPTFTVFICLVLLDPLGLRVFTSPRLQSGVIDFSDSMAREIASRRLAPVE